MTHCSNKGQKNKSIEADINANITNHLNLIYNGSLTIINQDGYSVQFNVNETYLNGDYLC